jgi:hypothetical protein
VTDNIYVRLIDVHRLVTVAGGTDAIGNVGYSGAEGSTGGTAGENVLFTAIPASIQVMATGRKKDASLPQDIVFSPAWRIYIAPESLPKGSVRDRDIIVDDELYRYEVAQAYWNLEGWKLVCVRLEA